jgi:hypothetical protein
MSEIAAPVRITADENKRTASFAFLSLPKRALHVLFRRFIRREDDVAKLREGCAWCDATEYDLNYDEMTGRRRR